MTKYAKSNLTHSPEGWFLDSELVLNLAAITPSTNALGPGPRAALWVQGCRRRCKGCLAVEWLPVRPAQIYTIVEAASVLLQNSQIQGITISGGEPMLQASALSQLLDVIRKQKDLNVICFTGYKLKTIKSNPPNPGVKEFLEHIDVLIDGRYQHELNDNQGLRGSSNQQTHYLTPRMVDVDFQASPRKIEIHISDGEVFMIGIPTREVNQTFENSVQKFLRSS